MTRIPSPPVPSPTSLDGGTGISPDTPPNVTTPTRRDVASETNAVTTGAGKATSSHKALGYNLISPHFIRRLAERLTGGGVKYGSVQWRQGINDAEYIADRFNHFFEHLLKFMDEGNVRDDNLGAMIWGLHALVEVERLAPEALGHVVGMGGLFGEAAGAWHEEEMRRRGKK